MKRTFPLTLLLLAVSICCSALTPAPTGAKDYFDGKPYGWATCADESGAPYNLKGGLNIAQPKTIILKSNGANNDDAILAAIQQYDIIVLDGAGGDFIINKQMGIVNAKHKTIVGRNNATLRTRFVLTADVRKILKTYNLEGLSSTNQISGTLPDGTKITNMDERAFYTRKALQEIAYKLNGNYDIDYMVKSGIFSLNATCEDIIFRNLTLVGPGSIDIDGVDLITNQESNHTWVDHCTFIDGLDGCLDSKRNDYASYTWNLFYYTENSFSHSYTTACGWVENHSMMQHLTFANNIWGKGCSRRLPQASDCYIHLLNNYHNCAGNSIAMTLNGYMKALVEGNYAAAGVNSPLCGSADASDPKREHHRIYAVGNSFSQTQVEASCRNNDNITVPYEYNKISFADVPKVLTDIYGAGAELFNCFMPFVENEPELSADNFGFWQSSLEALVGNKAIAPIKNLLGANYTISSSDESIATVTQEGIINPKAAGKVTITITANDDIYYSNITQTISLNVTAPSTYETIKLWDFNKRSDETVALLNSSDWAASGGNYTCDIALNKSPLTANNVEIEEAKGLLFTCPANQFVYYSNSIRMNKPCAIYVPDLKKDDKIAITWKSANSSAQRGFTTKNLSSASFTTDGTKRTVESNVLEDGEVEFNSATGGIYIYSIELKRQGATGIKNLETPEIFGTYGTPETFGTSNSSYYNLAGQKITSAYKGIAIKNGKKVIISQGK